MNIEQNHAIIPLERRWNMETKEFLTQMSSVPHVTGYETEIVKIISGEFSKYAEINVYSIIS